MGLCNKYVRVILFAAFVIVILVYIIGSPNRDISYSDSSSTQRATHILAYHSSAFEHLDIDAVVDVKGVLNIPPIIHQTWPNKSIPLVTKQWVEKWRNTNPQMQYWFWTDAAAHKFMEKKYPEFLELYNSFPLSIHRADAIRYFILYEFGGIYADLDVEPLKNLDPVLYRFKCVLSQEPEAHSLILHPQFKNAFNNLPCNAFMACRPKHPFFREILDFFLETDKARKKPLFNRGVLMWTGPGMVARVLETYLKREVDNPNYEIEEGIFLSPPEYFIAKYDHFKRGQAIAICKNKKSLDYVRKQACAKYEAINFRSMTTGRTMTVHHWFHSWLPKVMHRYLPAGYESVNISSVIPYVYFPFPS